MEQGHRVVILGGGFGGLVAAQKLKRAPVEVTLIDRRNFHLFQPLLYQVATGSLSSYYGNDSWREWAPSLKSVEEATAIRHKILYAFECAERAATPEEARAWLTFVIVGAGATGLELSGALAEIARETLRHDFRKINPQEA